MRSKDLAFQVKAFDPDTGVFEGYASVFGVKDSYGDVVVAGAFADTLANDFGPGGSGVPCWWSHQFDDPFMNIGTTLSAVEDEHGLLVKVALDLSTNAGSRVHALLVEGRVSQMSFGYKVQEGAFVESDDLGFFYEIRKVKLYEVSVVPIGANDSTEILSAKADAIDGVAEALHAAHAALAHAFKSAGLPMPGGDSVAPEGHTASDVVDPDPNTPAAPVAGDPDSESEVDDEPDAAKDDEPGGDPEAKSDEPASVKSAQAANESSSLARAAAALRLAGI